MLDANPLLALKKSRKGAQSAVDEFQDEPEEEYEQDLFDQPDATPTIRDPSAQLQPLLAQLEAVRSLPSDERAGAFADVRVGVLRRIVQLYPSEEVEGLRGVLRSWRMLGGRVTRKTAEEIVGRLVRLDRADLAVELANNRTQCMSITQIGCLLLKWRGESLTHIDGLPALPTHIQSRLLHALLQSESLKPLTAPTSIPISKTLATLRLAMRHKLSEEPLSREEVGKLVGQVKKVKIEAKDADVWRSQAKGMLEAAGGLWADAAKRIDSAAPA
jgi:hypothetical protein